MELGYALTGLSERGEVPPKMQGRHAEKGGWYPIWAKNKGAPYLTNIRVPRMDQNLGGPLFCKKNGQNLGKIDFFSQNSCCFFPKIFHFFL